MCLRNMLLKGFLCITSIPLLVVVQAYLNYFIEVQGSEHPLFLTEYVIYALKMLKM